MYNVDENVLSISSLDNIIRDHLEKASEKLCINDLFERIAFIDVTYLKEWQNTINATFLTIEIKIYYKDNNDVYNFIAPLRFNLLTTIALEFSQFLSSLFNGVPIYEINK